MTLTNPFVAFRSGFLYSFCKQQALSSPEPSVLCDLCKICWTCWREDASFWSNMFYIHLLSAWISLVLISGSASVEMWRRPHGPLVLGSDGILGPVAYEIEWGKAKKTDFVRFSLPLSRASRSSSAQCCNSNNAFINAPTVNRGSQTSTFWIIIWFIRTFTLACEESSFNQVLHHVTVNFSLALYQYVPFWAVVRKLYIVYVYL